MYNTRLLAIRANMRQKKKTQGKQCYQKKQRNEKTTKSNLFSKFTCHHTHVANIISQSVRLHYAHCNFPIRIFCLFYLCFVLCLCRPFCFSLSNISTIFESFCDPSQIPWWNYFESHIFPRKFHCYYFFFC